MPACIYFLRLRSALLLTNRGYVSLRRLCNLPWTNAHPCSYFHCSPFERTHCMGYQLDFQRLRLRKARQAFSTEADRPRR